VCGLPGYCGGTQIAGATAATLNANTSYWQWLNITQFEHFISVLSGTTLHQQQHFL
jgi:hypothetical protein